MFFRYKFPQPSINPVIFQGTQESLLDNQRKELVAELEQAGVDVPDVLRESLLTETRPTTLAVDLAAPSNPVSQETPNH